MPQWVQQSLTFLALMRFSPTGLQDTIGVLIAGVFAIRVNGSAYSRDGE